MRFRRRQNAPPEPEADDSAWARPPEGQDPEPAEPAEEPGGEPAYEEVGEPAEAIWQEAVEEPPEEPAYEPPEEPAYELPEEPAYEPPEEPAYEPPVEAASELSGEPELPVDELVEVPGDDQVEEPIPVEVPDDPPVTPVTRWRGGREDVTPGSEGTVRAAGGVVWSRWQGGLRVVVVHRPRYDDWSLPKGKAGPGESDADCALREVREETGLACSLGEELGTTTYHDRHGRLKTVRYYAMQPLGGGEGPQAEVDEVRWLGLDDAKLLMTYERDVDMLDILATAAATWGEAGEPPAD